jgi:hypothetical protein
VQGRLHQEAPEATWALAELLTALGVEDALLDVEAALLDEPDVLLDVDPPLAIVVDVVELRAVVVEDVPLAARLAVEPADVDACEVVVVRVE